MRHVIIHTDGSCDRNPGGPGGWAAIVEIPELDFKYEIHARCAEPTTSNRMELTGAIEALRSLTEWCQVDLYTDSQYLQQGAACWMKFWHARGWHMKGQQREQFIKNYDLWQRIWDLCLKHNVKWHWVRGHQKCEQNIRADYLAGKRE